MKLDIQAVGDTPSQKVAIKPPIKESVGQLEARRKAEMAHRRRKAQQQHLQQHLQHSQCNKLPPPSQKTQPWFPVYIQKSELCCPKICLRADERPNHTEKLRKNNHEYVACV